MANIQRHCSYVAKIMAFETSDKMGVFGIWCDKCVKYLTLDTFITSSVDARSIGNVVDGILIINLIGFSTKKIIN